eukprot:CAMPEP_0183702758 /NCGR_PEP_ID=MMETSP0737-20130205/759_1 /TAXON_ID=385413 /ORGANISM="Thalassiosira miniscula, Strain CCMP1093" /LENGTH=1186 /DNA_ID=CAMNT_0025929429 /DNA_START=37 /DNA_END=3598 /DNA_ORIENTATION=+
MSNNDNSNTAASAATPSNPEEATIIVSFLLQEFYDNNAPEVIVTSGKILATLLRNAARSYSSSGNPKHGTVRLTNPKIQRHVAKVPGALDILVAAGFAAPPTGGETLTFRPAGGRDSSQQLIDAICNGLEMKLGELDPQYGDSKPKATPTTKPAAKPASAKPASATNDNTASDFLSEKERAERAERIRAIKRAKKAQRDAAKERWREDMEERKVAAQRREALLQNIATTEASSEEFAVAQHVHIARKTADARGERILPKPFEDVQAKKEEVISMNVDAGSTNEDIRDPQVLRRQLIQTCMKNPNLTAQEKQLRIQQLMKMGSEAILAAVADPKAAEGAPSSELESNEMAVDNATKKDADENMQDNISQMEMKQPPHGEKLPPSTSLPSSNDLSASRKPTPPSPEWTQFLQHVPRCSGAEGIRETSVFYKQQSASDMAVPKGLKRLFRELDQLKNDLPGDPHCSIWLRFDEETPQYIRALFAAPLPGPTPYSGGLFAFDLYIPNDYPHTNPKVQFLTTGGGRVRFGPNLYANGKVCLSLLGTWPGRKWNPKHSSLYQLLISIQGLILGVEHPYYLEPGHGGWEGTVKDGDFQVTGQTLAGQSVKEEVGVPLQVVLYEDVLRVGTARHAMISPLKSSLDERSMGRTGLEAFGDIVRAHFCENRAAILAEVKHWMSDHAFGRDRTKALDAKFRGMGGQGGNKGALQIDALQTLLPKLEDLLNKASIQEYSGGSSTPEEVQQMTTSADNVMDMEEDSKPRARPTAAKEQVEEQPTESGSSEKADVVEQKRQKMQEAAGKGDFITAGNLQEEIKRLEELQQGMQEAVQQNDFIKAGRLQAQFKALTEDTAAKAAPKPNTKQQMPAPWDDESSDHDENFDEEPFHDSDNEEMDWDDDGMGMGMGGGGPSAPPFAHFPHPHGLGSNVFAPPQYKSQMRSRNHSWGTGQALAAPPAAPPTAAASTTSENSTKAAAAPKSIPPHQLCRLRIRLPQDTSVVEDFDKDESLADVYRRLEPLLPDPNNKQSNAVGGGPLVTGGAFSQPLSSAGFTLLLTRPKREFSLEMHGTKTLMELNLAPSATLTVMKCNERGVMYRGEVESRLRSAQGDAMDVEGLTYEGLMELTERVGKAAPKEGEAFLNLTIEQFESNTKKISPSVYLANLESSTEEHGEEDADAPFAWVVTAVPTTLHHYER